MSSDAASDGFRLVASTEPQPGKPFALVASPPPPNTDCQLIAIVLCPFTVTESKKFSRAQESKNVAATTSDNAARKGTFPSY
jgi:hypothetical protein